MAYIDELVKALKSDDPDIRVRVARALKELEDPRATIPLVEALNDEVQEVRRAAAFALHWVGDERTLDTFIELLEDVARATLIPYPAPLS